MKYEQTKKIIDGAIENEFNHVQEFRETHFSETNKEQNLLHKTSIELMDKLMKRLTKEEQYLLSDFSDVIVTEWTNLLRFYFREGVKAGLINLKYLNEIDCIECLL